MLTRVDVEFIVFTFIISQTLMTKEDTGVPVILRLEVNDGKRKEMWNLSRKSQWERIFEVPNSYWKQGEKIGSLLKSKGFLVILWGSAKLEVKASRVIHDAFFGHELWGWELGVLVCCQEENSQVDREKLCWEKSQHLKDQIAIWGLREVGLNSQTWLFV